jgi:uncharacterized protein
MSDGSARHESTGTVGDEHRTTNESTGTEIAIAETPDTDTDTPDTDTDTTGEVDDVALDPPMIDDENASVAEEVPDPAPDPEPPARFIPVAFIDVELTLPSTHPVVILEEIDAPHRQLRIPIGIAEGSAIAYAYRAIPTPRPLTHEFATNVFDAYDIILETVRITEAVGNAYRAEAVFSSPTGQRTIPCRPSDGICFAFRQRLMPPIAVAAEVFVEMGYSSDQLPN